MHVEQKLSRLSASTIPDVDVSGTWKNELASTMTLTQNGSIFSGAYVSPKSGTPGETATGKVAGTVNGQQVAFTVRWDDFPSITAWVGEVVEGSKPLQISTLWQMTSHEDQGDEWASINAGADTFTQQV